MARQYKRKYELSIIGSNNSKAISDLRVSFEITKSVRSFPNIAKIDIYNPNDKTLSILTTEDPLIILNAGYDSNYGLIFKGKIRNIFNTKDGVDRVVTIWAADGDRNFKNAVFNKTLSENVPIKTVVTDLFNSMIEHGDLTLGQISGLDQQADKLLGQSLSGASPAILDKLAMDYGFSWSIQDGEIIAIGDSTPYNESLSAVVVKQTTGMIGSPTITEIGADVTSLLNPELLPNRLFVIESDSAILGISSPTFRSLKRTKAEGLYRAFEVIFKGDTHSNAWQVTAKGAIIE